MKPITSRAELINWFQEEMLAMDEDVTVARGFLWILLELFDSYAEPSRCVATPSTRQERFNRHYAMLSHLMEDEMIPVNKRLVDFIARFHAEVFSRGDAVSLLSFIRMAMTTLGMRAQELAVMKSGGEKWLVSTKRFESERGFVVRVSLTEPEGMGSGRVGLELLNAIPYREGTSAG